MIGEVVRSEPGGRGWAVVWFLAAAGAAVASAATWNIHLLVLAVLPAALGVAALTMTDPPIEFTVGENGLEVAYPDPLSVPYQSILGLTARGLGKSARFPIRVYHPGGTLVIPPRLTVLSKDLYDLLLEQLTPQAIPDSDLIPAKLRPFVCQQLDSFGVEKVFIFQSRPFPPERTYRRARGYTWAAIAAGVIWGICGGLSEAAEADGGGWVVAGATLGVTGLIVEVALAQAGTTGRPRNWRHACLVVSPGGIGLVQGSLQGRMRWDELRAIEFPARGRLGLASHGGARHGLGLLVEGAYFIIADIYTRPLARIEACLRAYWGGRERN